MQFHDMKERTNQSIKSQITSYGTQINQDELPTATSGKVLTAEDLLEQKVSVDVGTSRRMMLK